ncbi:hypothetical protein [Undibacterium sp. KW1]|uniref:hypothetical protein n=1 Tax=Undibacterium sp. KW1 TaxID=2058624 RepID=UPI001389E001|nr:hypothetical protein [Undibacterium sp. KW1]
MRIGDLWLNGQLKAQPGYELEEFQDINIDRDSAHLIKAGLNLDDKGFLLPMSEHPWHMNCTQSYCVMLNLPGNRRLIIPCMELIRFYFGSSSNLITALFLPPLNRTCLYTKAALNKINGRLSLQLAEHISGASAADIGRLHLDATAWQAALTIGISMLASSGMRQPIYPQGLFPFEGTTTLIAAGKWLSFADAARATFIVYSLRSCSHAFPFRSLRYEKHKTSTDNREIGKPGSGSAKERALKSASESQNQSLEERDGSNNLASKVKSIRMEPRFPDLTKKSIWKNKTLVGADGTGNKYAGAAPPVQAAAVGQPGSEQRIRSVDFSVLINRDPSQRWPVPNFLKPVIVQLSELNQLNIELLTESEEDGWTVPILMLSDEDGVIDPKLFIENGINISRPRRVAVFAIKNQTEHISLAIVESVPLHTKLYATNGENVEEILDTLSCVANDYLARPELEEINIADLVNWVFDS